MSKIKYILKTYSFYPFILLPYVILYIISNNYKETNISMSLRPLIIGISISILLFLFSRLIIKDKKKSAFFTFLILLFLTTYGIRYDFLETIYYKGFWPFKHIHRILIFSDIILLLLFLILLVRSKKRFIGISSFLNTTFTLLLFYNVFIVFFNYMKSTSTIQKSTLIKSNTLKNSPNIYYFILDGYANNITLKKQYNYNNHSFINELKSKKFFVQDTVFSNYYGTDKSLASTLNMDYNSNSSIFNNISFKILHENDYKINVLKSGYSVTANFENVDNLYQPEGLNELERSLLEYTIFRLDDIIGGTVFNRIKNQINSIDKFITTKNNQFNFIHIVCPHPPFVFDRNGKKTFNINKNVNNWEPKDKYVDQLIYINKVIMNKITKILEKDPRSIIIIQSDHGPYISSNIKEEIFEARALILNCIYGPENLINEFKKTNSSVNTFRHLFNYLFNSKIPHLKDSLIGKKDFMNSVAFKKKIIK